MTPLIFEVTLSKVKVTVPFNAKTMSTQYLEKFMSDSHGTIYEDWSWSVDDPYKLRSLGQRSRSQYHLI